MTFFYINCILLDIPNLEGQNINSICRLECGNFVMMLTVMDCFYVGEVLDIYKQALSSRYGSVDDDASTLSISYLTLRVYLPLQVQTVTYFNIYSSFLFVYLISFINIFFF